MSSSPLYKNVVAALSKELNSGVYSAGAKFPTMRDLCQRFEVSHLTVLHALKELNRHGLIIHRGTRGYFVAERGDFMMQTRCLGSLLRPVSYNPSDDYFNRIIKGLEISAFSVGYTLLRPSECIFTLPQFPTEDEQQRMMDRVLKMQDSVDGFFVDQKISDEILAKYLPQLSKPLVIVNRPTTLPTLAVPPPNYHGMQEILKLAQRLGYTVFIYIVANLMSENEQERQLAFEDFVEKNPLKHDIIDGGLVYALERIKEQLDGCLKRFSGERILFATSTDYLGRLIAEYLKKRKVHFKKEVGLASFEGLKIASETTPRLTTVACMPEDLGRLAFEKMSNRLRKIDPIDVPDNSTVPFTIQMGDTL